MIKGNITVTIPFSLTGSYEKISARKFKTEAKDAFVDVLSEISAALDKLNAALEESYGEGKFVPKSYGFDATYAEEVVKPTTKAKLATKKKTAAKKTPKKTEKAAPKKVAKKSAVKTTKKSKAAVVKEENENLSVDSVNENENSSLSDDDDDEF